MDMNFLGIVARLVLLVLSVYLFSRTYSPPVCNPSLPSLGPSISEKREWFFVRVTVYVCPLLKIGYSAATVIECLSIITTYSNNSTNRISLDKYLVLSTRNSQQSPGYIATVGLLVGISGGLLRISCYKALGSSFTFDITRSSPKLITSGPYSLIRHPSYLAIWLVSSGVTVYHLSPGSWLRESGILKHHVWKTVVGFWVFITVLVTNVCLGLRMEDEDQLMKKMFGEEWEAWRKVVRYRVFPGLY